MKKRRTFSGNFKAKVLGELLSNRKTLKQLADQFRVHPNQIKNWKSLLVKRAPLVLEDKRRRRGTIRGASERHDLS